MRDMSSVASSDRYNYYSLVCWIEVQRFRMLKTISKFLWFLHKYHITALNTEPWRSQFQAGMNLRVITVVVFWSGLAQMNLDQPKVEKAPFLRWSVGKDGSFDLHERDNWGQSQRGVNTLWGMWLPLTFYPIEAMWDMSASISLYLHSKQRWSTDPGTFKSHISWWGLSLRHGQK